MAYQTRYMSLVLALPALLFTNHAAARLCPSVQDFFDLSLEELGSIQITGSTLTEKQLPDVPASVTVFSATEIHTLPVNTVEELMNYVAGMQAYRSSDISSAFPTSVRGRRGNATNVEILVLLNGMRIDNFSVGGTMYSFPNIPLGNVKRIEYIRGPGSAVYGSNAFTGVINIITETPCNSTHLEAGNNGRIKAALQQRWQAQKIDTQLFVTGEREQGESYRVIDPATGDLVSVQDPQYNASLQLNMTIKDKTHLQWVSARNQADGFFTAGTINESFNRSQIQFHAIQLTQEMQWHRDIHTQLQLSAQYSSLRVDDQPITPIPIGSISNPPSTEPLLTVAEFTSTEYNFNWKNDWTITPDSSLQFGLEYRHPRMIRGISSGNYDIEQLSNFQLPVDYYGNFSNPTRITPNVRADISSLYAQLQKQFNSTWEAIAGGRYDYYSQIGGHFSPRLGLIAHASPQDSFKLLYGEAFRAPVTIERYSSNTSTFVGNPDLQPETVTTWELIWLRKMGASHLELNYFYNEFSDAISLQSTGFGREYINSSQRTHSDGVELEWFSYLSDSVQLRASVTRLLNTPDTFYQESHTLFSAALSYDDDTWYGSLTTQYRSSRKTVGQSDGSLEQLKPYWLFAGKVGYRWTAALETYGEIRNALDEEYYTPAATYLSPGVPNRGRELRIGFHWSY